MINLGWCFKQLKDGALLIEYGIEGERHPVLHVLYSRIIVLLEAEMVCEKMSPVLLCTATSKHMHPGVLNKSLREHGRAGGTGSSASLLSKCPGQLV